jgi:hypothetical protein
MNVDFTNLRINLAKDFNNLVAYINDVPEGYLYLIKNPLYDLRASIGTVL